MEDQAKRHYRAAGRNLALEKHRRISLDEQTSQLPGATGLRALAAVMTQHGEDTMLAIYDRAAGEATSDSNGAPA